MERLLYCSMMLIQLTGLSGAGKTTIANKVKQLLTDDGLSAMVVDGDEYRQTLCRDLGFSRADRQENIRRLGSLAGFFVKQGAITIIAAINPYEMVRTELEERYAAKTVWVNCDLEELIRRDTKGLYKRALLPDGNPDKITNLTGVNDTFEAPHAAHLVLNTGAESPEQSAGKLYQFIKELTNK